MFIVSLFFILPESFSYSYNDRLLFFIFFFFQFISYFILFLTQGQGFSMTSQSQLIYKHITQRRSQKVLKQITSYNIATTCWPSRKYIYFKVGQLQCVHRLQFVVYKVDQFVLGTLSSSFIIVNSTDFLTTVTTSLIL